MGTIRRKSAAAARRLRQESLAQAAAGPDPLSEAQELALEKFVPRAISEQEWVAVRPLMHEILRRSGIRGTTAFKQHMSDVTLYLAWAYRQGCALQIATVLDHKLIEEWARIEMSPLDDTTRNTRRSRLRSLASNLNPGPTAPPRGTPISRAAVRPPYTDQEAAAIVRIATTQPSPRMRRQLCALVGLGLGAGLDSTDLRHLRAGHVQDRGDAGVWVNVTGTRTRLVVVRRQHEDLVRAGIEGLAPGDLVLGKVAERKAITSGVIFNSTVLGDAPHIEQTRLRSTWITHMMCAQVPLAVLMTAAGVGSARTFTDLLPFAASRAGIELMRDAPG